MVKDAQDGARDARHSSLAGGYAAFFLWLPCEWLLVLAFAGSPVRVS